MSIKANSTSEIGHVNKTTNVEVQISSSTSSFLSSRRQGPVVIKEMLSFLYWSGVSGPVSVKTWVYPERHKKKGIINWSKQRNKYQAENQILEI